MATLSPVYRDDDVGARVRYAELLALWNDRRPELLDASAVHAVRVGRAWAGSVGIASAALLVIATLVRFVGGDRFAGLPTLVLLAAWAARPTSGRTCDASRTHSGARICEIAPTRSSAPASRAR